MSKAIIAMSGGVDSSVSAYIMKSKGFDCIGVTMKLFSNESIAASQRTCCSAEDTEDARSVCIKLGIPYYVFNFTSDFENRVIEKFAREYESGATPNPCIDCNRYLKFGRLFQRAKELGIGTVATGHYARIREENGRMILLKAVDAKKDQSYVLYAMTQEQLRHTNFPLGEMTKEQVREIAAEQGFYNSAKPDSQDICFVPDGNYGSFLEKYRGRPYPNGDFVNTEGSVLGKHRGIVNYTVGQRRGLGISSRSRLYVCEIDNRENKVILGTNEELFKKEFDVKDFNWIMFGTAPDKPFKAAVRVRYHQKEQEAVISPTGENTAHIELKNSMRAVTKGQAAVVYDGDFVIGGGTIF
ncbi:MAG: tRNA 2-thiouridine(34) synthase MnmA [Clostridiales bacterium]|nr:tRNA 2-thiouridine(34) synthase MnmA [Clostridiales bacterium]